MITCCTLKYLVPKYRLEVFLDPLCFHTLIHSTSNCYQSTPVREIIAFESIMYETTILRVNRTIFKALSLCLYCHHLSTPANTNKEINIQIFLFAKNIFMEKFKYSLPHNI